MCSMRSRVRSRADALVVVPIAGRAAVIVVDVAITSHDHRAVPVDADGAARTNAAGSKRTLGAGKGIGIRYVEDSTEQSSKRNHGKIRARSPRHDKETSHRLHV